MAHSAPVTEQDQDWELVDAPEKHDVPRLWPSKEAYLKIEQNPMQACRVRIGDQEFLFCLEPKAPLERVEAGRCSATLTNNCRTCIHRMPKFAQFIGSGGKKFAFCQEVVDASVDRIRSMRDAADASQEVRDYKVTVIDAEFESDYPICVGGFEHIHFTLDGLTPGALASKFKQLVAYTNGSFDNRFEKLVDNPESLELIRNELPNLARPDHWRPVTTWAADFVARANGCKWSDLQVHEKYQIMVCALLTGRSAGGVHMDMQQASNVVDFMESARDLPALRAMMDDRSNPETYQVSRVSELLKQKAVTSLCTVTLVWGLDGQPHKSDLDLHTKVGGAELYYGNKRVGQCQLDFDANAQRAEKNPAENISLNQVGTFEFRVNNYNNRDNADVPFEVIVRKPGFEEVHRGVWARRTKNGQYMPICSVIVTAADLEGKPVELSETEQKKLGAKEAEWAHRFGEPTSTVASEQDLPVQLVTPRTPSQGCQGYPEQKPSAQAVFSGLLAGKPATPQKPTLAERCKMETLTGFIQHVTSTPCALEVSTRDFVPAYVTRVDTATDVAKSRYSINAYHRKHELPQQPRSDEQSSARLDAAWGVGARATVLGFVEVRQQWLMVLKGACLPSDSAWPLGGGMYPTQLQPEMHHHRSKWTSFHSLVTPSMPGSGAPLIGAALVGFASFQFILNGREITVQNR